MYMREMPIFSAGARDFLLAPACADGDARDAENDLAEAPPPPQEFLLSHLLMLDMH